MSTVGCTLQIADHCSIKYCNSINIDISISTSIIDSKFDDIDLSYNTSLKCIKMLTPLLIYN